MWMKLVALVINQAWFLRSAVFNTNGLKCQIWYEFIYIGGKPGRLILCKEQHTEIREVWNNLLEAAVW